MSFIERLKQKEAAKSLKEQQLKTQQEVRERERLQRQAAVIEFHAKRKEQAGKFRDESGVGFGVEELLKFFETPITTVVHAPYYTDDGSHLFPARTEYIPRGSRGITSKYTGTESSSGRAVISLGFRFGRRDPDSVFDTVHWDTEDLGYSHADSNWGYDTRHSEKYLAVETCPDGTIVFHAGWFGGTTIRLAEWRAKDKGKLFEKALEKAYKHPGINIYTLWQSKTP